ncbi:MAG: pyridoxal phosphate-dependent aminotransferase [Muribaculaceae bacterium]|nr:pyridoxal phosphate-dependent aminotransferase [Muribaculaceae bacterium]
MNLPIAKEVVKNLLAEKDIANVARSTIRQQVAITTGLEKLSGDKFVHLEIGVPGIPPSVVGTEAQKRAIDNGVTSIYPVISGLPELKENASQFIKAFLDIDITPKCIIPTVGSMQGSYNLIMECSQLDENKDTILFINPGFPPQMLQAKIVGAKQACFDIYDYRGDKLEAKLEEYFSTGKIAAIIYSNPNNPAWYCLTEQELQVVAKMADKYDAIVIEDLAYFCMDFRRELSKPFEPPYQSTVAKYTDNYVLMMSGSKIFSYAGERIAIVAFSNKMFDREYPRLRQLYGLGKMGDNYVLTYLYAASSGTSHSAQYALSAMMKAAVDGEFDFVKTISEYGRRAKIAKKIFDRNGFNIVYDKDGDEDVADGFYFTIGYQGMDSETLLTGLLRCGISAMALDTTGSSQPGIRACVSTLSTEADMEALDERLALFVKLQNEEK